MRCHACNHANDADATTCASCGAALPSPEGGQPEADAATDAPPDAEGATGAQTGGDGSARKTHVTATPGWDPSEGSDRTLRPDPPPIDVAADAATLGRFHPAIAARIAALLTRRQIPHRVRPLDDYTELDVDVRWRDDVRSELVVNYPEVLRSLDPDVRAQVVAAGGSSPGWFDAPRGGHIDRAGRLVVDRGAEEDAASDAARVIGPAMLVLGAIMAVLGWQVTGVDSTVALGVAMILIGALLPF